MGWDSLGCGGAEDGPRRRPRQQRAEHGERRRIKPKRQDSEWGEGREILQGRQRREERGTIGRGGGVDRGEDVGRAASTVEVDVEAKAAEKRIVLSGADYIRAPANQRRADSASAGKGCALRRAENSYICSCSMLGVGYLRPAGSRDTMYGLLQNDVFQQTDHSRALPDGRLLQGRIDGRK